MNKHFLNSILTTASTLALTIGTTAYGSPVTHITNGTADIAAGTGFTNGPFVSNDNIQLGNASDNITIDADVTIGYISNGGFTPTGVITVTSAGSGSIITNSDFIPLVVQNNVTSLVTSSENIIRSITIGNNSYVTFNDPNPSGEDTLGSPVNINGASAGEGTITMNGTNLYGGGSFGGSTSLAAVNFNGNINNSIGAINATTVNLNTNATIDEVTATTLNIISGNPNFDGNLTATTLNIQNGSASVGQNASPTLTNINFQNQNSALNIQGYTVPGNLVNTYGSKGSTALNSSNNQTSTFAGNVGTAASPISAVNFVADQILGFDASNTGSNIINIYAPITTATNNTGTFQPYNGTINTFYDIGTSSDAIKNISLNYDSTWSNRDAALIINSGDGKQRSIYAPITTNANVHNAVTTNNTSVAFYQNIGANGASLTNLSFNGTGVETISFGSAVSTIMQIALLLTMLQ